MLSRRTFLRTAALAAGAPLINRGRFSLFAGTPTEYSARAIDLVRRSTVIDMLGLVTLDFQRLSAWQLRPNAFTDADFERIKSSGITVFHPAVGFTAGDIHASSYRDITQWNIFLAAHSRQFVRIEGPADIELAKNSGKIGIIIGQQNSSHFRTVDDVDQFYGMGQRVSQLTYDSNRLGGGCTSPANPGLTEFGAAVVERMNRVKMAIDVSHCAERTTLDAIAASKAPVLITHSNCRALVPNAVRCKSDESIERLAERGGVMGVTMIRAFVKPAGAASIEDVLDHIEHVVKLVGVEHVGLGTDADLEGWDPREPAKRTFVEGVHYSRKMFDITEGLLRRNYKDEDIQLILGGNFKRALDSIWAA